MRSLLLRRIRNIFFCVLAVMIILLATISALVETETGSRWLITRVANLVNIELRGVRGDLRNGLDVESLEYRNGQQLYNAKKLSFRWRPVDLLYGSLLIQSLHAESVFIHPPPPADNPPTTAEPFNRWPQLRLPISIQLQQLRINNIELVRGETRMKWQKLHGSLSWGAFYLRYNSLAVVHEDYSLVLTGNTAVTYPYATDANLQWQWQAVRDVDLTQVEHPTPALAYMGVSDIEGDLKSLQVSTHMSAPVIVAATVKSSLVNEQDQLITAPLLDLDASWKQQILPAPWWVPNQPSPITNGELTAKGNWQEYTAELQGDIHLPQAPMLGVSASVRGDLKKIHIDFLRLRERYLSLDQTAADVNRAAKVVAPLATHSEPAKNTEQFIKDFNTAIANVASNSSLAMSSAGVASSPTIVPQYTDTDAGLEVQGDVRWLPQLDWQLTAQAEHLNLASLFENWPSNISATFKNQGVLDKQSGWDIKLQDLNLDGDLRGVNLRGGGSLAFDGQQLHTDDLQVVLGANQLQLKGDVGKNFNLDWNINAPMLGQIDSSVQGSVITKGKLRGNAQQPQLDITADVQKFSWAGYGVEKLQLSLVPALAASSPNSNPQKPPQKTPQNNSQNNPQPVANQEQAVSSPGIAKAMGADNYLLSFSANQLRLLGNRFSTLSINGEGSVNQHRLQAVIKHTGLGRADVTLDGKYGEAQWQGQFDHLAIKLKKVPRWWLTSSKPLTINSDSLLLGRQCFTTRTNLTGQVEKIAAVEQEQVIGEWMPNQSFSKPNVNWLVKTPVLPSNPVETYSLPQLCIEGDWSKTSGARLNANLDSVPLRQFLSLFKTEVFFAGVMDGSVNLVSPDLTLANTVAKAGIATRNAELRYQYAGGVTEVYAWRDFFVRANLEKANLIATAGMEWTGYGRLDANTALDLQQQKINSGKITAQFSNLAPLETLLSFANDVKGDLHGDLTLGGTFARPQVVGDVSLRNGSANIPRLGVDLTNVDIQINSVQSGNVNLVSQFQSGEGRLTATADVRNLGTPDWAMQGFVNGNNFQVVALPQLKATLSPDIRIHSTREQIELTGTATIPYARANIKTLPETATAVSPDVVVVDEQYEQEDVVAGIKIITNLDLAFGDDVRFKGFGLNSKLVGKLKLFKESNRQFFTSGYVSVEEGSYKAYGQTLTIDRGRLNFQGPYENPGLEIRASRIIRDEENTKVGLEISGTLQRPKAQVFSSELMSESQAMMMLMTGKPMSDASKADASLLVSAMSGLGMDSGDSITADIRNFFHVDELEIKSDQGFDQSELWVGKYLTPRLLVRYVVGIFQQAFGFGVEYQLTERLRLEAVSADTQSVDVVYKVER